MVASSASPWRGLANASTTTTPSRVTMKPALGRPSTPRPVSPGTTYTPSARRWATYGGARTVSPGDGAIRRCRGASSAGRRGTGPTMDAGATGRLGGGERDGDGLLVGGARVVGPGDRE